ncbi:MULTISPECIES: ATP-dependent nuclease [Paenibacillus]|uniref:ATP-dependent endonuclease n=3 Tax=Paenibacillus TaxID=44249 RepID=A0ABX2Z6C8_PAEPO|nr:MULTISPECIES: AAA family ATPase [Paenibacillus]MDR6777163.1 putative ATP-dependent endonuclease of OLD family [Paenibacillus peoriae]ODA06330.1 hypothetical protein A7312_15640 [Paenibacillus polymyxa]OME71623.1 hypothetical protein BK119_08320 [Paenibacillus peoriae]
MQVSQLKISNFRSFNKEETVINLNNLTAIIGANSCGKTALIQGLLKLFGVQPLDRTIERSDFHLPMGKNPEDLEDGSELYIEAKIEFPELRNEEEDLNTIPQFFKHMVIDQPNALPYVRIRLIAIWNLANTPEGVVEEKLFYVTVPEGNSITEEDLRPVLAYERAVIQLVYIPAMRDPLTQLRNVSGTILYRLMTNINWPKNIDEQIKHKMKEVEKNLFDEIGGVRKVRGILNKEWGNYHWDDRYRNAEIAFNSTTLSSILKRIEVQFSPTLLPNNYSVEQLGDGLRSLFYLSLVASLLEMENEIKAEHKESKKEQSEYNFKKIPTVFTILAVEEPENHIAPHLLGKVMQNLRVISTNDNAQVLVSSHSESIIKQVDPLEIRHIRIGGCNSNKQGATIVKELDFPKKSDEAYKYIKEAIKVYPELYFAKLVILGEGDSEEIIIPKMLEVFGLSEEKNAISVVPLGGVYVNHMWRLLNALDIPHITLLDLDRERNLGGWTRVKYVINQLLVHKGHVINKEKLLEYNGGVLKDSELVEMHKWPLFDLSHAENMDLWRRKLMGEEYGIHFSYPLDIDFVMLEAFSQEYIALSKTLLFEEQEEQEQEGISEAIKTALKRKVDGYGGTYTEDQKKLMIHYSSLFLSRSKPSTHFLALSAIGDEKLKERCPVQILELINSIKRLLGIESKKEGDINEHIVIN